MHQGDDVLPYPLDSANGGRQYNYDISRSTGINGAEALPAITLESLEQITQHRGSCGDARRAPRYTAGMEGSAHWPTFYSTVSSVRPVS